MRDRENGRNERKRLKKSLLYKTAAYREYSITEYCPYSDIVDDRVFEEEETRTLFSNALMQNKDGSIGISFEVRSPFTNNSEDFEVDKVDRLSEAFSYFNSKYTVHFETVRTAPKNWYKNESGNMLPFDAEVEDIRAKEASSYDVFEVKNYMTINYAFKAKNRKGEEDVENPIENFYVQIRNFLSLFESSGYSFRILRGDELLTYLHRCLTMKDCEIHCDVESGTFGLDEFLTTELMDTEKYPMKLGDKFVAVLSVSGFRSNLSYPEHLSPLFLLSFPFRIVNRFRCYSVEESEKICTQKRELYNSKIFDLRKMIFSSDRELDPNVRQIENKKQCEEALSTLTEGGVSYGLYTGVVVVEADSEEELKKRTRLLSDVLVSLHIAVKDEKLNAFPAFLSSLPHDSVNNPRQFMLSTFNFACYCNLVSYYQGRKENAYLKGLTGVGTPHLYGYLRDTSPYCLNLNGGVDDVGHTLVIGKTGAGKSYLISLLASQFSKYGEKSRVVIFDRGYSQYNLVKRNGGNIIVPFKDDTVFNPLFDVGENVQSAEQFLNCLLSVNGVSLNAREKEEASLVLLHNTSAFYTLDTYKRQLKGSNQNHPLVALLEKYTTGDLGALFNNVEDKFLRGGGNRLTLVELDNIINLGRDVVSPALIYMFERLVNVFKDKKPTLLVLDECWTFLLNEVFRSYLIMFLKTMRKNNVFVVMSTQDIKDLSASELAESTVLSSVHTRIFCPDENALKDETARENYGKLGLLDFQKNILKTAVRKSEYYIMQSEGDALVNFRAESLREYFTSNIREASS